MAKVYAIQRQIPSRGRAIVGVAAMLAGFGLVLRPRTRRWGIALLLGGPVLAVLPLARAEAAEGPGPGIVSSGEPGLEVVDISDARAVPQETTVVSIMAVGEPTLVVE